MSQTWTVGSVIQWTTDYFTKHGIPDAGCEAETLLSAILNCPRLTLHLRRDEMVPEKTLQRYRQFVIERQKRRPVAYITGEKEFMGLRFFVNEHTLIPRPDTEHLVEAALARVREGMTVIDLCTGSGCIAVSIAKLSRAAKLIACDISRDALAEAQANIDYHGVGRTVFVRQGDLFAALGDGVHRETADMIVSNPPYIAENELAMLEPELGYEPRQALFGGRDGLDYYRRIAEAAALYVNKGGYLLLEIAAARRAQIQEIVEKAGWTCEEVIRDYAGLERVLAARLL